MKLTALLKKIGRTLNPFRAAMPEDFDNERRESGLEAPDDILRTGSQRKKKTAIEEGINVTRC